MFWYCWFSIICYNLSYVHVSYIVSYCFPVILVFNIKDVKSKYSTTKICHNKMLSPYKHFWDFLRWCSPLFGEKKTYIHELYLAINGVEVSELSINHQLFVKFLYDLFSYKLTLRKEKNHLFQFCNLIFFLFIYA